MIYRLVWLMAAVVVAEKSFADEIQHEKLRQLVEMPKMSLSFQFGFTRDGFVSLGGDTKKPDEPKTVESLKKSLKGTYKDADAYVELARRYYEQNDKANFDDAVKKCVELYREGSKAEPDNISLHAEFSQAL